MAAFGKYQYRTKTTGTYGQWVDICVVTFGQYGDASCRGYTSFNMTSLGLGNLLVNGTTYTIQVRAIDTASNLLNTILGGSTGVTATPIAAAAILGEVRATPSATARLDQHRKQAPRPPSPTPCPA